MGKHKRRHVESSEESSGDESHDVTKADEIVVGNVLPSTIREFSEIVESLLDDGIVKADAKFPRLSKNGTLADNAKVKNFLDKHSIDWSELKKAFDAYLNKAASRQRMPISVAVGLTKQYASTGEAVKQHPRYPQPPLNIFQRYLNDRNKSLRTIDKEEIKEYREGGHAELEEALAKEEKEYVEQLSRFLEEEKQSLTLDQCKYISAKIRRIDRKYNPPSPRKSKKQKSEPKTAFDYFKATMIDEYPDMDPAKLDAKLQKKFRKLSEAERKIFIKLEQNQSAI